jgi:G3E family GTPase
MSVTPVTVLTGFLGSGKTTLLNRWVRDARFADMAILVNEWGDVPVDHALVRESSERIVVLAGGCICCRMAGDVVRALRELHYQRAEGAIPPFSRVVIETTGLADPGPLLATLIEMPLVAARYALSGVVATVDAEHGAATLDRHEEAVRQVAMADRLVVTKVDRAAPAAVAALHQRLAHLNPGAPRYDSPGGDVDPTPLLEAGLYRGEARRLDATGWLQAGAYRRAGAPRPPHDPAIAAFAWTSPEPRPWDDVETALETLLELLGERILRLKGLVAVEGEAGPRAVHAVGHTLYPSARLPAWPDADHATRIVVIGRGLEEGAAAKIFDTFLAPSRIPR